jgi:hypothetical protein
MRKPGIGSSVAWIVGNFGFVGGSTEGKKRPRPTVTKQPDWCGWNCISPMEGYSLAHPACQTMNGVSIALTPFH